MTRPMRTTSLVFAILLVSMLALSACGGSSATSSGGETTLSGQVTKVDTSAKTFTVDSNGKSYNFKLVSGSAGDINEIKKHMDTKEQIDVKYKGTTAPYDVVSAD